MTFDEIERVVGTKLPPSAFKYRSWWSNNPTNSVITHAWLKAGYKTVDVDMPCRKLAFQKSLPEKRSPETADGQQSQDESRVSVATAGAGFYSCVFGALKCTVTITPGTDLTSPVGGEWAANQ